MKILAPVLLICFALAGCGGGGGDDAKSSSKPEASKTQAPKDAEAQVRDVFNDYNKTLLARDFGKACGHLAPETTNKLRENIKSLGDKNPPKDCAKLLDELYSAIDKQPDQKKLVEEILKSAKLDSVKVVGEKATVNWHATVQGQKRAISQTARKVDGEWKLVDVTN